MKVLAGTSKGIFAIKDGDSHHLLESLAVRDLVSFDDRLFAGTGAGLASIASTSPCKSGTL